MQIQKPSTAKNSTSTENAGPTTEQPDGQNYHPGHAYRREKFTWLNLEKQE
jgi:hypothetical protein